MKCVYKESVLFLKTAKEVLCRNFKKMDAICVAILVSFMSRCNMPSKFSGENTAWYTLSLGEGNSSLFK
jgi:hypothetical protein